MRGSVHVIAEKPDDVGVAHVLPIDRAPAAHVLDERAHVVAGVACDGRQERHPATHRDVGVDVQPGGARLDERDPSLVLRSLQRSAPPRTTLD